MYILVCMYVLPVGSLRVLVKRSCRMNITNEK